MRSTKVQSLLYRFKTTDLAKSIGTDVNKLTTSNETCDLKSLILVDESKSTNSFEFLTEYIVVPTKGDKTFFKNLDKLYVAEPTNDTIGRKGTFGL